jgi:transposase
MTRLALTLSDEEKVGASKVFFTKVKEELQFIPAQLKVLEYWQEKAVFEQDGQERILAAQRPVHSLGKCSVTTSLLAYIIISKYADGLPLYRLEKMLKRLGHEVSRTNMAHWVIRLEDVLKPLIHLMQEVQNSSDYLQADGYSGYGQVCRANAITRIGCWDHARRKFVEASKAAQGKGKAKKGIVAKADVALSHINKLYAIERQIKELSDAERHRIRQAKSLPQLDALKTWLEANVHKVLKGSLTRKAMEYTLNQWTWLVGYCDRGDLQISNILAENAIRPFAIGRKAWLFSDTLRGARASATCYSLIETAKANGLEPSAYIQSVLERIADAQTLEKLEQLLPWNAELEQAPKK